MVLPSLISVAVTPGVSAARTMAGAAGMKPTAEAAVSNVRLVSIWFILPVPRPYFPGLTSQIMVLGPIV